MQKMRKSSGNLWKNMEQAERIKKIEELILQLYEYSRSYPDPRQWLISCAEDYEIDREHLEDSRMVHTVEERVRQQLGDLYGLVRQAMKSVSSRQVRICMQRHWNQMKRTEKSWKGQTLEKMSEVLMDFNWKKAFG